MYLQDGSHPHPSLKIFFMRFKFSTILTFIYTEIFLDYFTRLIVYHNFSVEISYFFISFATLYDLNEFSAPKKKKKQ